MKLVFCTILILYWLVTPKKPLFFTFFSKEVTPPHDTLKDFKGNLLIGIRVESL